MAAVPQLGSTEDAVSVLQRGRELLPVAAEKTRKFPDRMPTGPCAAGLWSPESCSFFYHGKLTRRPGAAEEPYSAHMLIRRAYSLFLLCKKERAVPELTTRFLSQQSVFHK